MTHRPQSDEEGQAMPRCNLWWLWGLLGGVILIAGTWLVGLSVRGAELGSELRVNAEKHQRLEMDLLEIKTDVKELLRRSPAARATDRRDGEAGGELPPTAYRPPPTESLP